MKTNAIKTEWTTQDLRSRLVANHSSMYTFSDIEILKVYPDGAVVFSYLASCPPICPHANLPAFDGYAELGEFIKGNASVLARSWTCTKCGHLHADFKVPGPSGASSGTERDSKLPPGFKPFWRGRKAEPVAQKELPRTDRPVKAIKLPAAKPDHRQTKLL